MVNGVRFKDGIEMKKEEKVPFIHKLLEYRKWAKIHDTYLSQYRSEIVDGRMHAYTNLNRVDTFRTSMSDVNLQNIPKRDKEVKKLLRSFLKPDKGCKSLKWTILVQKSILRLAIVKTRA